MTEAATEEASLADYCIPKEEVSRMLIDIGVDLSTPMAESYVVGATDMLLAVTLAQTLPEDANHLAACEELHTVKTIQPEPVRLVQQQVAHQVLTDLEPAARERMDRLLSHLGI